MKKPGLKIIIVDDHILFSDGLKTLIEHQGIGEVVAQFTSGEDFIRALETSKPDLVLMDIEMPGMSGLEATRKALKIYPDLKILVVSMFADNGYYEDMLYAGVKGFVLKSSGKKILERAIADVAQGESYFSNDLLRRLILKSDDKNNPEKSSPVDTFNISRRELEVLELFCQGLTAKEIAQKLFVTPKTIDAHRTSLLRKTDTRNTTALVLFAIKKKIVEL